MEITSNFNLLLFLSYCVSSLNMPKYFCGIGWLMWSLLDVVNIPLCDGLGKTDSMLFLIIDLSNLFI